MRALSLWAVVLVGLLGCGKVSQLTGKTFHQKCGWKAKDFFDDPQVIALCHAIEKNDIAEIDRLVADGANVNALGKDNMTPLLWAYPDNNLERFTRLLHHGADPNVSIKSDLNTRGGFGVGDSVTHMACRTTFPGYFEAVFEHGGDPNLVKNGIFKGDTPLFSVVTGGGPNKKSHLKLLIEKGANVNHLNGGGNTPVMQAVSWGGQYVLALELLRAGADWKIYLPNTNTKLVHLVAMEVDPTPNQPRTATTPQSRKSLWTPQQATDYEELVKWLEDHGESIDVAKADIKRHQSWSGTTGEYRRKLDAEIAERVAREAKDKAAAEETDRQD